MAHADSSFRDRPRTTFFVNWSFANDFVQNYVGIFFFTILSFVVVICQLCQLMPLEFSFRKQTNQSLQTPIRGHAGQQLAPLYQYSSLYLPTMTRIRDFCLLLVICFCITEARIEDAPPIDDISDNDGATTLSAWVRIFVMR